ncbi:MAG: VCBS repeat-containing protein [Planctomycetales bacterium]|nr:VCBS repeat-containing protein [Planctomycetales bacterium]MCA9169405.1 VCBS repeat-containing protein [Planctomycetales bacterium]
MSGYKQLRLHRASRFASVVVIVAVVIAVYFSRAHSAANRGSVQAERYLKTELIHLSPGRSDTTATTVEFKRFDPLPLRAGYYELRTMEPEFNSVFLLVASRLTLPLDLAREIKSRTNVSGIPTWSLIHPLGGYKLVGDLTGDGILDIVAARGDGEILLLSGANGRPVWTRSLPGLIHKFDAGYDLDHDGHRDLILEVDSNDRVASAVAGRLQIVSGYGHTSGGRSSQQFLSGQTGKPIEITGQIHDEPRQSQQDWCTVPTQQYLYDFYEGFRRREGLHARLVEQGEPIYQTINQTESNLDVILICREVLRPTRSAGVAVIDPQGYSVCILDQETGNCRWRLDTKSIPILMGQTDAQTAPLFWVDNTCFAAKSCQSDGSWSQDASAS